MSTIKFEPVVITERETELDLLACKAHGIDEKDYPEMANIINQFLVLDAKNQDYVELANRLMGADSTKRMPKDVVELVVRTYEYAIEEDEDELAANNLACLYYSGRIDGEPDYNNARKYYEIASRFGYVLASENLAYIYYYGFGTDIDYSQAYKYFSKAALRGRYEAMYKVGDMFRYGYYVEKDDKMTANCYFRAMDLIQNDHMTAEKCYGGLYHRLADLFYDGIGVEKDLKEAMHYYQLAEIGYYQQIEEGDRYHYDQIQTVIAQQKKIRRKLQKALPDYSY